jgi:hypothetical protein
MQIKLFNFFLFFNSFCLFSFYHSKTYIKKSTNTHIIFYYIFPTPKTTYYKIINVQNNLNNTLNYLNLQKEAPK